MSDFDLFVFGWMTLAALIFITLLVIPAPYGRHLRRGWGPMLPATTGWTVMESTSLITFVALFGIGGRFSDPAAWIFCSLWTAHYVHRSWIYPRRMRMRSKMMPVSVVAMAVVFNSANAGMNGYFLFLRSPTYDVDWLLDPRFVVGLILFVVGATINLSADTHLRSLRAEGDTGYFIPTRGLFRLVSCPNYLGEMIEWIGFAVLTWSLPGLAFAWWTIANLAPRAIKHHRCYQARFPDYPQQRRALIPFVL
jgi:protein-S-isoprenylcysteine O-methyltransferase Ste14